MTVLEALQALATENPDRRCFNAKQVAAKCGDQHMRVALKLAAMAKEGEIQVFDKAFDGEVKGYQIGQGVLPGMAPNRTIEQVRINFVYLCGKPDIGLPYKEVQSYVKVPAYQVENATTNADLIEVVYQTARWIPKDRYVKVWR